MNGPRPSRTLLRRCVRGDARALAGGTDLVPQLREGRRTAACVVDLKHVADMVAIGVLPDGGVSIGAAASATAVARHAAIAADYPAVARSAQLIGGVQVQNRASLGGNICNAAPSADGVPALVCLARTGGDSGGRRNARDAGRGDVRRAGADEPCGRRAHGCDPAAAGAASLGGGLSALHAAARDGHRGGGLRGLAAARRGRCHRGGAPRARFGRRRRRFALSAAEHKLVGERPSAALFEEAGRLAAKEARPISDTRGSADFRRTLVAVLTARALADCGRQLDLEIVVR